MKNDGGDKHREYISRDDDSEIEMRETDAGIAISLRMIEDGLETAGTTFYLRPEQVSGMAAWLSARTHVAALGCLGIAEKGCTICGGDIEICAAHPMHDKAPSSSISAPDARGKVPPDAFIDAVSCWLNRWPADHLTWRMGDLYDRIVSAGFARSAIAPTQTWPALPGQKALTFLMMPDESGKAADAAIEALKRGDTTFIPTPISELFFHQLRLHVARDPSLVEKIAVYYLTPERQWAEVGLSAEDELRWPVGFCHEAWEAEIKIKEARQIRRAAGRADAKEPK